MMARKAPVLEMNEDNDYGLVMAPPSPPRLLVAPDPDLDTDFLIFDGIDVSREPLYTVGEASKFFFRKTSNWLRMHERKRLLYFDGRPILPHRSEHDVRLYTLADIEMMAHALAERGMIQMPHLLLILHMLQDQGKLWGYLPTPVLEESV